MNRFKMSFNNSGLLPPKNYSNLGGNISIDPPSIPKQTSLNSPMIDRVYKAKAGCSACGKKVA